MPNRLLVVGRAECDHMPLQINRFWAELSIFSCIYETTLYRIQDDRRKCNGPWAGWGRMRALCEYDAERETPPDWQFGQFPSRVGEHIYRIGRDQQDAFGVVLHYLGYDHPPDSGVVLDEIKSSVPGFLACASGQHGYGCAGAVRMVARPDACRMSEGHGVIEIHGFAFRLGAVGINQHDFRSPLSSKA
jgi:hypothetical protein